MEFTVKDMEPINQEEREVILMALKNNWDIMFSPNYEVKENYTSIIIRKPQGE